MKNLFYVALAASALMFTACTAEKSTPEIAADKYVKGQIVIGEGLKADTSGLTFTLIETIEETALVEVAGTISVEGQVQAVKNEKGQWEIK
ncbi:hypothetical protein LZ24_00012 [Desulfobotulus alkaliphilus]|uniref:Uncharacterized protein n=1 Tax=Desulfobotulus alkaliphilus TaxID=622671 RepID=A0A562S760_9BACT|nr:hypothetical protein [Desulfobotulus alkaliphilus]TWI77212.1 hypothetical protein LZ24_00012 [Desulfobotulus alkaliphilus]